MCPVAFSFLSLLDVLAGSLMAISWTMKIRATPRMVKKRKKETKVEEFAPPSTSWKLHTRPSLLLLYLFYFFGGVLSYATKTIPY